MTETTLPRYRCHKEVFAIKIARIETHGRDDNHDTAGTTITPQESGYAPFETSFGYAGKHNPQVGGYWVRYDDGYESYSPAKAFEEGYTLIGN